MFVNDATNFIIIPPDDFMADGKFFLEILQMRWKLIAAWYK